MTQFAERWHLELALLSSGVGLVAAVPLAARRGRPGVAPAVAAAIVLLVVRGLLAGPWLVAAVPVALLARRRSAPPSALGALFPVVAATSLAGLWATVPDTETPLVLAAVLGPTLLLLAVRRDDGASIDLMLVVAAIALVTPIGAGDRVAAYAGAACCAALLVVALLVGAAVAGPLPADGGGPAQSAVVLAAHVGGVVIASRVVGHAEPTASVVVSGLTTAAVALVAALALPVAGSRRGLSG